MTDPDPSPPGLGGTLKANIADLARRHADERRTAPMPTRIAERITAFAGSMTFVALHLVLYGAWIVANVGWVPGVRPFDPTFVILAMEASVEAIFLSTFVLISQNRMAAESDRRAALDLHINLLAEHELTQMAGLVRRIADKLGIDTDREDLREIEQDVAPVDVLDAIERQSGGSATPSG